MRPARTAPQSRRESVDKDIFMMTPINEITISPTNTFSVFSNKRTPLLPLPYEKTTKVAMLKTQNETISIGIMLPSFPASGRAGTRF